MADRSFLLLKKTKPEKYRLNCNDKFGVTVKLPSGTEVVDLSEEIKHSGAQTGNIEKGIRENFDVDSQKSFVIL